MSTHVKGYLQETTVHGFRYVVEGRTVPERLAWVVAILLAFAYASILVHSAMREAEDNPVSTAIEIGGIDLWIWKKQIYMVATIVS